jgi:hypothetical protein
MNPTPFMNYDEHPVVQDLNTKLIAAIQSNDLTSTDQGQLLLHRLRPSSEVLEQAIMMKMDHLIKVLLQAPYSLQPTVRCLHNAVMTHNNSLFLQLIQHCPSLVQEMEENDPCLELAIQTANYRLVKHLVLQLGFAVYPELCEQLHERSQPQDHFTARERQHQNGLIRSFLRSRMPNSNDRLVSCKRNLMTLF